MLDISDIQDEVNRRTGLEIESDAVWLEQVQRAMAVERRMPRLLRWLEKILFSRINPDEGAREGQDDLLFHVRLQERIIAPAPKGVNGRFELSPEGLRVDSLVDGVL